MWSYTYTKELQKNHTSTYKNFFARYDMVLSLPHLIRIGHSIGKGDVPLALRQKIPHQLFVWVNRSDHGKCQFTSMESFDITNQVFLSWSPYEFVWNIEHIAWACTQIMQQADIDYGFDIGILTEYPKWYGTSFNTVLLTLLAVVLFVQEKKLSLEMIKNYSFQHTSLFYDVASLACYMKYLAFWSAGSCLPFVALQQETKPVFQIGTFDFSTLSIDERQQHLWHLSRFLKETESSNRLLWWHHLPTTTKSIKKQAPFDVALLHVWVSYESLREKEEKISHVSIQQRSSWFDLLAKEKWIEISLEQFFLLPVEAYGHMSALLSIRLSHACMHLSSHHDETIALQDFLMILKDMGFYHCFVERHYEMIALLTAVFSSQKTFPEEVCAFLPMTMVKTGGTFLAVIPPHGERKTLEKTVTALSSLHDCPAKIVYASRMESTQEYWWVCLHQFVSQDIFSEYITPWTTQILFGNGQKIIGEYDVLLWMSHVWSWVVFDLIKRKILVNGKKVSYKELCSQSATIEIFLHLLDHIDAFVPNRLLPPSAYSKNKNEMISKILLPLQEKLRESCGEQMELICSWTLYEWTICLKKKPQNLHLIQYVHP